MSERNLSHSIGLPPFSREDMISHLEEFAELYKHRPIKDNHGGQEAAQLFYSWYVAKKKKPAFIIESGVYKGQGTWAFEQASPDSTIICLDPYPQYEEGYKSTKAHYIHADFTTINWSSVDTKNTLCFFDDHQNAVQRMISVMQWGFRDVMFEDNYPIGQGDCMSLKKVFDGEEVYILPKLSAKEYFSRVISVYHEMPPIYDLKQDRWGNPWLSNTINHPLLKNQDQNFSSEYLKGMNQYTWINYLELDL